MSVTVTYSDLILAFDIPEDLNEKTQELEAEPEIISLDEDGTLTVELDGEEYTMGTLLLAEERDALEVVGFKISAIEDINWGSQYLYLEFREIDYTP